jgi:hypothetical protein
VTIPSDPEEANFPIELTVVAAANQLTDARAATAAEYAEHRKRLAFEWIAAVVVGGDGMDVLVLWMGLSCDRTATLTVNPQANHLTLAPDPVGGHGEPCDLAPIVRGVVLTFAVAPPVDSMRLDLRETPIIEPS